MEPEEHFQFESQSWIEVVESERHARGAVSLVGRKLTKWINDYNTAGLSLG